jgi:hypothetical protein
VAFLPPGLARLDLCAKRGLKGRKELGRFLLAARQRPGLLRPGRGSGRSGRRAYDEPTMTVTTLEVPGLNSL